MSSAMSSPGEDRGDNSQSEEEFEDALDTAPPEASREVVDVVAGVLAIETAMDMMNKNLFGEAVAMLEPKAGQCMYHSMAYSSLMFLKAVFSMDSESIDTATAELDKTITLCNLQRRGVGVLESLSSWVLGSHTRMDSYSIAQLHSEVYCAEANLLLSFLTFLQGESLVNFVKGGLKIKSCFSLYKQLYSWLETCEAEHIPVDPNFASGVRMGIGTFNLFLSVLPGRVLKLLEFIGFNSNRALGQRELEKGAASGTFRAPICTSFLLFYHTGLTVMLGVGEVDAELAHTSESLLGPSLLRYPQSVQFLYFKGRVALLRGELTQAIECFNSAIAAQSQWRQVHHLCWWELTWCYCGLRDWDKAAGYAESLYKHSKWSKATFLYIKACCLIMKGPSTPADQETLRGIMRDIPPLKQRIAGKSIPMEKFAVSKSERFLAGESLPLCLLEMLYAHNFFVILAQNAPLLKHFLALIWNEVARLEEVKGEAVDQWCVAKMLQGVVFRHLQRYDEARDCFTEVTSLGEQVMSDQYCVAAASAELGLVYLEQGLLDKATKAFEHTKSSYKGYHLESRVHFRIHSGQDKISQINSNI